MIGNECTSSFDIFISDNGMPVTLVLYIVISWGIEQCFRFGISILMRHLWHYVRVLMINLLYFDMKWRMYWGKCVRQLLSPLWRRYRNEVLCQIFTGGHNAALKEGQIAAFTGWRLRGREEEERRDTRIITQLIASPRVWQIIHPACQIAPCSKQPGQPQIQWG